MPRLRQRHRLWRSSPRGRAGSCSSARAVGIFNRIGGIAADRRRRRRRQACAARNRHRQAQSPMRPGRTRMDFDLNDEQRQLKDSVERLLADSYGDLAKRHGYMKEPKGYSAALWKQYADLGLLAVPFAEEHGGLGQGLTETMIIAEAFGRALAHRALSRHRRAGRRRAAPLRQRRAAQGAGAGHRRGQDSRWRWRTRSGRRATTLPTRPPPRAPTARAATRWKARSASCCTATAPTS